MQHVMKWEKCESKYSKIYPVIQINHIQHWVVLMTSDRMLKA